MFDRLIESEPETADFKNRSRYFMVSSVVVGIVFLAAVVASIYAQDFGLGNGSLEMSELIAPVEMAATMPEPVTPRQQTAPVRDNSVLPERKENMATVNEPTIAPTTTSTVANTVAARPEGAFTLGKNDVDPIGSGRPTDQNGPTGPTGIVTNVVPKEEVEDVPPPKKDPVVVRQGPPRSIGVVNGRATHLPKPNYSAAAIAINAQGKVEVQVTIDETGRVISANAVGGHPVLRGPAEQAARNARFSPTLLSNVPVKVTGVIVYNFQRN